MPAGPALEMWSQQTGSAESPDGKRRSVTMRRAFTVTLDPADPLEEVYNAADLPLVNQLYPGTLFVICRKLTPTRLSPILAQVAAEYSGEIGPGDLSSSPIDNPVIVTWSNNVTEMEIDEDWNGMPIVTANNEPITGITERFSDQQCTIQRNFLTIDMYAIRAYLRSTNSDTFLGFPPGMARLMQYQAVNEIQDGVAGFWKVTATFEFREPYRTTADKAWYKRVRHEGFYVRDSAGDDPRIAWDLKTKSIVSKPVLLKADGTQETDPALATWLEFQVLGSLPYASLGLI